MAFEDIKDQIKDRLTEVWNRIQETPVFNNMRERYETMSPTAQKGLTAGSVAVVTLLLLMIPFSYFSSSGDQNDAYNTTRTLIRKLLHAGRLASEATNMPRTVDPAGLKSQIQDTLGTFALLPEQNAGVSDLDPKTMGPGLTAGNLRMSAIGVSLKKLSLKQVVEVGYELQDKGSNVKLAGIEINATALDPHYFDVLYKLVVYNMPGGGGGDNGDAGSDDSGGGAGPGGSASKPASGGKRGGLGGGGGIRPKPGNNSAGGIPPADLGGPGALGTPGGKDEVEQ